MSIEVILQRELTEEQYNAAMDPASKILCLACAGSGKSRTLAYRIARLIAQGENPQGIVAFTFTEKAAESIKFNISKALTKVGLEPTIIGAMYIGTIHSFCQNILHEMDSRYRQFEVLDENRFKLFLISRYYDLGLKQIQTVHFPANRTNQNTTGYFNTINEVASAWSIMNDEKLSISEISQYDSTLGQVLQNIKSSLDDNEYIDFSSMIGLVVDALHANNLGALNAVNAISHLMVDEYQDVNPLQEELIKLLHQRLHSLFVVGDDDQSIYAWRGADVRNILTFSGRYAGCKTHTLSKNFRSTNLIVNSADNFVAAELGATRFPKTPQAASDYTPQDFNILWFNTRGDEAEWVAQRIDNLLGTEYCERDGKIRGLTFADFAILMRSTRSQEQSGSPRHADFTESLVRRRINYSLEAGGSIFDRIQVSALREAFESLRNNSPDRNQAKIIYDSSILSAYPKADFHQFANVLANWGRLIHGPIGGVRRRVYPQKLVHDLLDAFHLRETLYDDGTMQDIGTFSKMIQDVETVFMSIDSTRRFKDILNFMQNVAESGYNTGTEDILRRPDAVTVSTVHKMKGLEFPVVFIVDVEARRFPGDQENYRGWLPIQVLQNALQRNAYRGTREEDARLFYTALTRAERYLYVTGCENLPGARRSRQRSPFTQRLSNPNIHHDVNYIPQGLKQCKQVRRIDETIVPTSFSDIRYYLKCPKDYQFRKSFGFSPPIVDLFGFGLTVHASICKLHELFNSDVPSSEQAEAITRNLFHLKHVPESSDPINHPGPYERARDSAVAKVCNYVQMYGTDFTRRRQVEVRFEIPVTQAVISGTIDLMLHEDQEGKLLDAEVIDFKAMEGGKNAESNVDLQWTELSIQVQLYAKAAKEVLGQNARTGAVHLLKDNKRISVPVDEPAINAAVQNVEWAVDRIISGDFPMRPNKEKCETCDFKSLCSKVSESFSVDTAPPPIHVPGSQNTKMARAFSEFDNG